MRIPLGDLERAVAEQASLRGQFVDNVYQCDPRTFLLKLKPHKRFLVIDLNPARARVLVTDEPPAVPDRPPVFGAILRQALRGGRLLGTLLLSEDRIVAIDVDAGGPRRVVVEAFGRHGNLLLLDADGTVERVLDGEAAKHRGNPIGARYALPPAPKIPPEASLLPDELPDEPFACNHALDRLARAEQTEAAAEQDEAARARAVARLKKTRGAVAKDLRSQPDAAQLRRQGEELLIAYAQLQQGMKRYSGVPLDPKLSPQENVERIFERARKADRAKPALEQRLAELDDLIRRAEAGEAIPARLFSKRGQKPARRRPYRVFRTAGGSRILVGKGGADNDTTTLKVAGPNDLFLHVRGTPGAHVIVPLERGEEIAEQTLLDAATLAVHYSKMRTAAAADVSYAPRKFVKKPKGAKPGLVQVQREKVLRLRREPDRLTRLLMSVEEAPPAE
ncbi:MAG: NFACT RNA binding domain-containing protein [Planctomycetota bacterium]